MATYFDPARHIVCLGYALEAMISCVLSFLEPRSTMIGHGFPKRIANDSATWPVYKFTETRSWVIGLLMFIFYFRGQTEVVDTIMAVSSAHEAVFDCYILYSGGNAALAPFRFTGQVFFVLWGFLGMSSIPAASKVHALHV
ncbi:hypothetical protein BJ166DRAFT_604721 [Pestalotiopsis sp. NC0098]|nr:hypothetical protein BJ166DRAFT_604721 [Pestalotiopsis sp. NC0098]